MATLLIVTEMMNMAHDCNRDPEYYTVPLVCHVFREVTYLSRRAVVKNDRSQNICISRRLGSKGEIAPSSLAAGVVL